MNKPKIIIDVIDTDSASQAVEIITRLAEENGVNWALVGGLAMNIYGSDRLTKDIDVIADALAIADMIALPFGVAPGLEDGFIRALGETGPAGNALFGDQ